MSRPLSSLRRRWRQLRTAPADAGFSLIEIMAAMLVFAVLSVAALAFIVGSLSATAIARTDTVAKNLNQELLESMRNLPYFAHANVSTVPDLLDVYYTSSLAPAPHVDASGFVASGAPRSTAKGDPATGPFFRRVLGAPAGYEGYTRRVTAQFLSTGTSVIANPVFVSTASDATGRPPSSTLAVRVTTLWTADGSPRSFTVESSITDGAAKAPLVALQGRVSVLRFTGVLPDSREMVAEAGVVNLDASLSATAVASAVVQAATANVAGGGRVAGAAGTLTAPPSATSPVANVGPQTLVQGFEVAGFGGTSVAGLRVATDGGLPGVGVGSAPVTTVLNGAGGSGPYFRASHLPTSGTRLRLAAGAVVHASAPSCGGTCQGIVATGVLSSTDGDDHAASASLGGALAGAVAVLPTETSPDGLIRLELDELTVTCSSGTTAEPAGTATVAYSGTLHHRTYDPVTQAYGYRAVPIDSTKAADPLAGIDLDTTLVGVDLSDTPLRLGDYIESWSSLTTTAVDAAAVRAADGTAAGISVPGVFTLTSTPLRADPVSTFGLQLGQASCAASDIR